ncbi:hypothetical protein HHK36_004058 [Tetracentron sinense]|uniref:J domain-containing protein n=1 Tax=Tetracentron sinense TaxID=13715 RepID=A0A834ZQH1_TETSI|nr:hypothetical protein HHK36_004058 [Tetracentron sinense]
MLTTKKTRLAWGLSLFFSLPQRIRNQLSFVIDLFFIPRAFVPSTKLCEEKGRTSFFKVLSLDPDHVVGVDEIKRAYRTMALQYHPDVCHPSRKEESTRMFVELNKAYKTLLDQTLAEDYDYEFHLREKEVRDGLERERWEEQLRELRKKSDCHMARKEGSWGSRLRAQHQ